MDLIVEDAIVVEIKAIEELAPIHTAQLLSYLRLSGKRVRLPINFHVRVLKDGLKRIVNEFPDSASSACSAVSE
jgi:GxxExxY protein